MIIFFRKRGNIAIFHDLEGIFNNERPPPALFKYFSLVVTNSGASIVWSPRHRQTVARRCYSGAPSTVTRGFATIASVLPETKQLAFLRRDYFDGGPDGKTPDGEWLEPRACVGLLREDHIDGQMTQLLLFFLRGFELSAKEEKKVVGIRQLLQDTDKYSYEWLLRLEEQFLLKPALQSPTQAAQLDT